MSTDLALARLLQLASPALPVGAYSYSQGLEAAAEAGIVHDAASAGRWIGEVLACTVARLEAPLWWRLHAAWSRGELERVAHWNDIFRSTRETAELRAETLQMGHSLRRLLKSLDDPNVKVLPELHEATFLALFAFAATSHSIPPREGLSGYLWAWLENMVMALLKAVPLGQTDGRIILMNLRGLIPTTVTVAEALEDGEIASSAPLGAMASLLHETQYTRLFRS